LESCKGQTALLLTESIRRSFIFVSAAPEATPLFIALWESKSGFPNNWIPFIHNHLGIRPFIMPLSTSSNSPSLQPLSCPGLAPALIFSPITIPYTAMYQIMIWPHKAGYLQYFLQMHLKAKTSENHRSACTQFSLRVVSTVTVKPVLVWRQHRIFKSSS
jgi:hypothetical protein